MTLLLILAVSGGCCFNLRFLWALHREMRAIKAAAQVGKRTPVARTGTADQGVPDVEKPGQAESGQVRSGRVKPFLVQPLEEEP